MEYVYAAMLLHKAGKKVDEASVKKVLDAAGVQADEARVKALVASLDGINIDEAIENASVTQAPVAAAPATEEVSEAKEQKEEKSAEDEKKQEEQAAAGLGALFG